MRDIARNATQKGISSSAEFYLNARGGEVRDFKLDLNRRTLLLLLSFDRGQVEVRLGKRGG